MANKKAKKAKAKASKAETTPPDAANHEGEIWHKPFSYTYKGHKVEVPGHWERKPGAGPRPKEAKAPKPKKGKRETVLQRRERTAAEMKAKGSKPRKPDTYIGRDPHAPAKESAEPITPTALREVVGANHHEAEQAASAGLAKLKAAQQKPAAVPPVEQEA